MLPPRTLTQKAWFDYCEILSTICEQGPNVDFNNVSTYQCSSKQFGPPLRQSDWYDLVNRIGDATLADEIKVMGKFAKKANTGVRKHDMRATVSEARYARSAREQGSDVAGGQMMRCWASGV